MHFKALIILSLFLYQKSYAQHSVKDSILISLKTKPKPYLSLHNRNTFIQSNRTKLYGLVGGVELDKKVKLFTGIYGYGNDNRTLLVFTGMGQDSLYRNIGTSNFSLGIEYKFFSYQRVSLAVPLQIGIGNVRYTFREAGSNRLFSQKDYVFIPLETGTNAYFSILPWFGLKGGLGYRLNIGKSEATKLSSPYYNLGVYVSILDFVSGIQDK